MIQKQFWITPPVVNAVRSKSEASFDEVYKFESQTVLGLAQNDIYFIFVVYHLQEYKATECLLL